MSPRASGLLAAAWVGVLFLAAVLWLLDLVGARTGAALALGTTGLVFVIVIAVPKRSETS